MDKESEEQKNDMDKESQKQKNDIDKESEEQKNDMDKESEEQKNDMDNESEEQRKYMEKESETPKEYIDKELETSKKHIGKESVTKKRRKGKKRKKTLKKFMCETCGKTLSHNSALKRHKFTHNAKKDIICDICEKSFSQESVLKKHMLIHTGKKNFSCEICQKSFYQPADLKRHKLTHTGEKKFRCETCQKSFTQHNTLKTHMLIHTGERNIICEICEKSFYRKSDLNRHMLIHTGEKKFVCEICQKSCSQKIHLRAHMLTHTGKKSCDQIHKKSFSPRCSVKKHTGKKNFTCEICQKSFNEMAQLKSHVVIHTDNGRLQQNVQGTGVSFSQSGRGNNWQGHCSSGVSQSVQDRGRDSASKSFSRNPAGEIFKSSTQQSGGGNQGNWSSCSQRTDNTLVNTQPNTQCRWSGNSILQQEAMPLAYPTVGTPPGFFPNIPMGMYVATSMAPGAAMMASSTHQGQNQQQDQRFDAYKSFGPNIGRY